MLTLQSVMTADGLLRRQSYPAGMKRIFPAQDGFPMENDASGAPIRVRERTLLRETYFHCITENYL